MQFSSLLVTVPFSLMAMSAIAATHSFEVTIHNKGETVLACDATIAHWFSDGLGVVAPGESLRFTLQADIDTGTIFLRNAVGDDMPVQRVWCGLKGKSWATRAEIALERRAGELPKPIALDCAGAAGGTSCAAP